MARVVGPGLTGFRGFVSVLVVGVGCLLAGCESGDVARQDPRSLFRRFVCDPAPASVASLQASGYLSPGGDAMLIRFRIGPEDFDRLLQRGGFHFIQDPALADVARGHFSASLADCESPTFFEQRPVKCRRAPGVNLVFLMANSARSECWFRFVHPGP